MSHQIRRTRRAPVPHPAAREWRRLDTHTPPPGHAYLISADYSGIETFDVAFYNGKRPDGAHWWTLGNVAIDAKCISHYAEIANHEGPAA